MASFSGIDYVAAMRGGDRSRFIGLFRHCWWLSLVVLLGSSCASDDSTYSSVEKWECFERLGTHGGAGGESGAGGSDAESACECFGVAEDAQVSDPRPAVTSCGGWQCCYAWPVDGGRYDCRCEDAPAGVQVAAFCESAATDRAGEVVSGCPPTPRDNPTYCASQGESCAPEYLEENRLSGCCEGSVCGVDSFKMPVCRPD